MKLVVDANAFFSAFLRAGLTRKIWFSSQLDLYAPPLLMDEYVRHSPELVKKSGQSIERSNEVFRLLAGRIKVVGIDEVMPYIAAAEHLTTDENDEQYIACALAVGADLWSHDRHLKQPRVRVWTTEELGLKLGYLKRE